MNDENKKELTIQLVLLLNLFLLIALLAFAFYYNFKTNTLKNNGKWETHKTMLEKSVMGANATMETTRALAGKKLDLSVWHGNQQLFLKDLSEYDRLSFKTKLVKNSHFSFFFHKDNDVLKGIRLSANEQYPSMIFEVVNGKFTLKKIIPFQSKNEKWVKVGLENYGSQYNLIENGKAIYAENETIDFNVFGFRGSERKTLVDNLSFVSDEKGEILKEKFNKPLFPPLIIVFCLVSIILFNVLLYIFRKRPNWIFAAVVFGMLFLISLTLYQQFYKQYRYSKPKKLIKVVPTKKKEKDIAKIYKKKKAKNEQRVLFIGSSQTWGAGALNEESTFVKLFETKLNYYNTDTTYVCINGGVSGQKAKEMLHYFQYLRPIIKPDVVVLNLSFNDNYTGEPFSDFKESIQTFFNICKEFDIGIVAIPEPMNPNHPDIELNKRVDRTQFLLDSIATANKVPVIQMQPYIDDYFDDGFLFWDMIHLSDYGHLLFAEEFYRQVILLD